MNACGRLTVVWLCLAVAGCGAEERRTEERRTSKPADPAVRELSAACQEYRSKVLAQLPPTSLNGYVQSLFSRTEAADRLASQIERTNAAGRNRARRGSLLAAAAEIQSRLAFLVRADNPDYQRGFANRLARGFGFLLDGERALFDAAKRAGVPCEPPTVSAPARAFRTAAGKLCERTGPLTGDPRNDAAVLRARAERLESLPLPPEGRLERAATEAQARLADEARVSRRGTLGRKPDPRYVLLTARVQELWAGQGVYSCAASL